MSERGSDGWREGKPVFFVVTYVCGRAYVRACVCACVRSCVCVCVCVCARAAPAKGLGYRVQGSGICACVCARARASGVDLHEQMKFASDAQQFRV